MIRAVAIAAALLAAGAAGAFEKLAVVAVADPPLGPDADLAELAHQLRAACRDRIGGVQDVPTMRARLVGQTSNATLSELDRAYGGALAIYQNGEFESALRTLHAIVEDLESLPETEDSYSQWVRAQLRLAHAALTIAREREAEEAFFALARTDLSLAADPDQYSPSYRRRFEGIKGKVRALPARRLTVTAQGQAGTVFVNGRPMGTTPLALRLPAGTYRIGGRSDSLRVPSFRLDLRSEDRSAILDFALADSLRVNAGPGFALPVARRGDGIVRAGAWLGVDRIVAVSRVFEGQAAFLLGSIYDVRRGALLREGSVRTVAGSVPAANLGALAAFLLTGQSSRDVVDRTPEALDRPAARASALERGKEVEAPGSPSAAEPAAAAAGETATVVAPASARAPDERKEGHHEPVAARAGSDLEGREGTPAPPREEGGAARSLAVLPPPASAGPMAGRAASASGARAGRPAGRRWMRPAAIGAGVLAGGFAALSIQQALAAHGAYSDADAMVEGGVLRPGSDVARFRELRADGDAAKRNAYVSAGAAAAFAVAAGVLGWRSVDHAPDALALRF